MKNIYKSDNWRSLDLDVRVDLVPVLEGVRPGAFIEMWKKKEMIFLIILFWQIIWKN
jgi:hypothetical protein